MEYLFVYGNGGWWLKITDVEELLDYIKKTSAKFNEGMKLYLQKGHPRDILADLNPEDYCNMMQDPNFKLLYSAVLIAERKKVSIIEGFEGLAEQMNLSKLDSLQTEGVIYINSRGGYNSNMEYTQFCRRKEFVFPDFKDFDIRIKQFDGGTHYYAYIGDMEVKDGDVTKWDSYDDAYKIAKQIVDLL